MDTALMRGFASPSFTSPVSRRKEKVPGVGVEPRRARGPWDFKAPGKGQRTKDLFNSLPFSRPRSTRRVVESEWLRRRWLANTRSGPEDNRDSLRNGVYTPNAFPIAPPLAGSAAAAPPGGDPFGIRRSRSSPISAPSPSGSSEPP